MVQTALAVAAALVALAFAMSTFERWLAKRRLHELVWSVALLLFSLASWFLAAGAALGWNGPIFRGFFLFGAIINVPFLAAGTIALILGPTRARPYIAGVCLFAAFAAGVIVVAPFTAPIPRDRLPQGSDVFGVLPRVLAGVASGVAALVVVAGAGWSAWRARRGPYLWSNVLIAVGTLVTGASGLLNSTLDEMEAFAITLAVGITLIFAGFLIATSAPGAGPFRSDPAGSRPGT